MDIRLEPKQGLAFTTDATEFLYGGAAGGMKSFLLRASVIRWCMEVGGLQAYLFRRTLPDLRDNHLRGPTSFFVMLESFLGSGHVKYRSVENEFEFWNGSILHLCYCDSENDVEKYRGAEIHVLAIDELTHFSEYQYRFLRSRVRIAGLSVPEAYRGRLPRIETASNPGSVGHAWVKRTFVSPKPALEIWRAPSSEGGMLRQFIPAKLQDNPYLMRDDPTYADRLRGMGADDLVRAILEGDWDIIAGQAFEKLRRDVHCIEPFEVPGDWLIFGSLDWGSTRPFSFGLWAVSNGDELADGRSYQRGALIRFNEWYGWNGKPNEGCRMAATDIARGILEREERWGMQGWVRSGAADTSIFDQYEPGKSIAGDMERIGVYWTRADKGKGSRKQGWQRIRSMLKAARVFGYREEVGLWVVGVNCPQFLRTVPTLPRDPRDPDDVNTDAEDHIGDELRYRVRGKDLSVQSGKWK